jgi:hypothetical protein
LKSMININAKRNSYANHLLAIIFILYVFVLSISMMHHELWGDELHSWNIAKASTTFSDLIHNTRYEGHPPVWYTILWIVSKFTHNVRYIQVPQFIIACLVVFVILFFSPFPLFMKILIPFGYYFLFEYGVLTRNYAVAVLTACCICVIMLRNFRYKIPVYYALLFIMANTHLLAMLLAGSLHFYFLLLNFEQKKIKKIVALHLLLGIVVFLPAFYFIVPPSDSSLNVHVWLNRWEMVQQLRIIFQIPFRSFIPIPAWWNYNFWNTEFLIEAQSKYGILKIFTPLIFLSVLTLLFFILKKNKKSLTLFTVNFLLNILFAFIFPLTTARYVGFIYIGFICSYWLYCYEVPLTKNNKVLVNILLTLQLIAGIFTVSKDIQLPFSNSHKVNELLKEVPANKKIVTDYWCVNTVSAFIDKPVYCLEMHKEMSFLLWDNEFKTMYQAPNAYANGVKYLFQKEILQDAYMISIQSPQKISEFDPQLFKSYNVKLIDKREGAIEKGSNLYLYQISAF